MTETLVFDIRRGCLDDGPGIRTTVFFKGCPLNCSWCHNPESISPLREMSWEPTRCIGEECGVCRKVCPTAAASSGMDRDRCAACGKCAEACWSGARKPVGRNYAAAELTEILLRDLAFYQTSGGGVTFSGGEPTLHSHYLTEVLAVLKQQGVHTAIQTCGMFDYGEFRDLLLPFLDLVFFDLKLMDAEKHRKYTGADNQLILRNLAALALDAPDRLTVRTPLVPEITAAEQNLTAAAQYIGDLGVASWKLLPFNPGGAEKLLRIGKKLSPEMSEHSMDPKEEERLREIFQNRPR
jgi:pyruvate formate lyase activating enzyme